MYGLRHTNSRLSWWGPKRWADEVVDYACPFNLTADSLFLVSSHCPVNSLGPALDLTADNNSSYVSSAYTTVDQEQ